MIIILLVLPIPTLTLNYIKDLSEFNDLLLILDIRMKNLNGFQLHQQIKAIY